MFTWSKEGPVEKPGVAPRYRVQLKIPKGLL